jgi:hypothetical protein
MANPTLSAADRDMARRDDSPDLPPALQRGSRILQTGSPALVTGDAAYLPGANPGDFEVVFPDERACVKGSVGITGVPVGFRQVFLEWLPNRGGLVTIWPERPEGAEWGLSPDGRKACLMPNGNKVEQAITAYLLVGQRGVSFDFRSSAIPAGRTFFDHAVRLRVVVDGAEISGVTAGKWRIVSRLEKSGDFRWFSPARQARRTRRPEPGRVAARPACALRFQGGPGMGAGRGAGIAAAGAGARSAASRATDLATAARLDNDRERRSDAG